MTDKSTYNVIINNHQEKNNLGDTVGTVKSFRNRVKSIIGAKDRKLSFLIY